MLIPAELESEELHRKFLSVMYNDEFYYYTGYPHTHDIDIIKSKNDKYDWIIKNKNNDIVGFFSYRIDPWCSTVSNFGLYSFLQDNIIGIDVGKKINELINTYHRIEFRMISGNPVERHYDRICKKYGGRKIVFRDSTKDKYGSYHDDIIYEIIREKS